MIITRVDEVPTLHRAPRKAEVEELLASLSDGGGVRMVTFATKLEAENAKQSWKSYGLSANMRGTAVYVTLAQ